MSNIKIGSVVVVKWNDAANHSFGWHDYFKNKPAKITTVGFLQRRSKRYITIVQSVCHGGPGKGSSNNAITIPRGCISSISGIFECH